MNKPKNVVLIMTDQQHFRTLGCHGVPEARTPNIDALATSGIDFQNHIVTNPVCSPSRASIITGLYPTEHGLWTNGCALPEHLDTIPKLLGRNGWQTAHFGKLHLVPIVSRIAPHPPYGFDTCEVSEGDQQLIDDDYFRWLRTTHPSVFVEYLTEMYSQGHAKGYKSKLPEALHPSTWVTDRAIDWLRDRRDPKKPFFLEASFFDPHHAFNPCEPYASAYDDIDVSAPVFDEASIATRPEHYRKHYEGCKGTTRDPEKMTAILKAYHAMVSHIDHCVGRLRESLDELGLTEDTVILFTSDHGELLGNHGLLWKGPYMLDDLLRVPLIVSAPGRMDAPVVTTELTSMVDLFATVGALAGCPEVPRQSGRSFINSDLELFPEGVRDDVLAEWEAPGAGPTSSLRCLRTRDLKLVHYGRSGEGEFYDLKNDPDEFFNKTSDDTLSAEQAALREMLNRHYLTYRPHCPSAGAW